MARSPLRTAFWALSTGIGLSLSLLAFSSFSSRPHVPPAAPLASAGHAEPPRSSDEVSRLHDAGALPEPSATSGEWTTYDPDQSPADSEQFDSLSPEPAWAVSVDTLVNEREASDGFDAASTPLRAPAPPQVPVNAVSHPEGSALAIGLDETLNPSVGNGEFIELPPPPEFDQAGIASLDSNPRDLDPEVEELIGRLQHGFEGLHSQFDGLHSQFAEELAAVQSSQDDLRQVLTSLVETAAARQQPPQRLTIDVTTLLMPLRGEARQGALALVSRDRRDTNLSVGPEIAGRIRWATSSTDATTLTGWLRQHGNAQLQRQSTMDIEPHAASETDLPHTIAPGMIQARGSQILERTIVLPWNGPLLVRASTTPAGQSVLELRVAGETANVAENWTRAALQTDGSLLLTAVLEEVYRPVGSDQEPAVTRRPAGTELIVLMQPRAPVVDGEPSPGISLEPIRLLPEESTAP